jgi:ribosome-interacting GTPase 1|tara:strand:+ start:375 stop:512 length:138 start_codon:yes stop_codon:yes gene_type:complete
MNEDQKIMYENKIHEVKVLIRDEFTLDVLIDIKKIIDDAIKEKED